MPGGEAPRARPGAGRFPGRPPKGREATRVLCFLAARETRPPFAADLWQRGRGRPQPVTAAGWGRQGRGCGGRGDGVVWSGLRGGPAAGGPGREKGPSGAAATARHQSPGELRDTGQQRGDRGTGLGSIGEWPRGGLDGDTAVGETCDRREAAQA